MEHDAREVVRFARLMPMSRPATAFLCFGLMGLAACGTSEASSPGSTTAPEAAPVPTIGIGSPVGQISGESEVRELDMIDVETIVMIGDSITTAATAALEEQFDDLGYDDVTIVSQPSKRMAVTFGDNTSGAEIAEFIAAEADDDIDPASQLWVVALGTNDIPQYGDVGDVMDAIDEVLDPIPDDAPLIWINTYFGKFVDETERVNEAIDRVIGERENSVVGRWDEVAPEDGVLTNDLVHPRPSGNIVFASLVTDTVADFLQLS